METRHIAAYAIIAALVLIVLTVLAYARHNTRDRKIDRQRRREAERR